MPRDVRVGVGVAGILFRAEDGKIPMSRRLRDGGVWQTVGGWVDFGESPEEALSREIKEEMGITIPASSFDLLHSASMTSRAYPDLWVVSLFYAGTIPEGTVPRQTEPGKAGPWEFFKYDELPEPLFHPAYVTAIDIAITLP